MCWVIMGAAATFVRMPCAVDALHHEMFLAGAALGGLPGDRRVPRLREAGMRHVARAICRVTTGHSERRRATFLRCTSHPECAACHGSPGAFVRSYHGGVLPQHVTCHCRLVMFVSSGLFVVGGCGVTRLRVCATSKRCLPVLRGSASPGRPVAPIRGERTARQETLLTRL